METNMSSNEVIGINHLCEACLNYLQKILERADQRGQIVERIKNQSFELFRQSAYQRCVICSTIWNLSEKHKIAWSNFQQEHWTPFLYTAERDEQVTLLRLMVIYYDPISSGSGVAKFRIIGTEDKEFRSAFCFKDIPPSTSSLQTLDLAYEWYQGCLKSHEKCQNMSTSRTGWMPSRLIDIGNHGATKWHLTITSDARKHSRGPPYMTLSYRWGSEPGILLLSSNIDVFRQGVGFERLPQLFNDFIRIARRFCVRYIWIDSLCIIQDSQEDWELEAPQMRYIYSGSVCNVAASAAHNPESGLFRRRAAKDVHPGLIEVPSRLPTFRYHYIFDKSYWNRSMNQGTLHNRGWVFQEVLLAPRVLYYSNHQILWECLSEHKCEGFPHGIPLHDSLKKNTPLPLMQHTNQIILPQIMSYELVNLWMDLVARYSCCEFTRPEDKLWAFSGIAMLFQGDAAGQYFAGLWESRLLHMLDWRVYEPRPLLTSTYRAPSWSWAFVDGPVHPIKPYNRSKHLAEILEAKVEPIGEPMGGISSAFLRLKGPLFIAKCEAQSMFMLNIYIDSELVAVQCYPDSTSNQLIQNGQIVLLLFKLQQHLFHSDEESWELMCIILQTVCEETKSFRRTGILTFQDEGIVERVRAVATEGEVQLL